MRVLLIGMDVIQLEGMILDCHRGQLGLENHYGFPTKFVLKADKPSAQPGAYHYACEMTPKSTPQS